jgi:hypothetical protein
MSELYEPSMPGAAMKYRSENKTPSIAQQPRIRQYAPEQLIGPFPDHEPEDVPPVGDEGSREIDGDNPAPMRPIVTYSQNCVGCPGETNLTKPQNTSSATVSAYLNGGR